MAIDTITPVADSILLTGDSVSFIVDDTYTTLTIEVETASGYEYAYDGALGGAQSGYTVSVVASGGRHTFTVTRSSGWNISPFNFRVVENETGSSATTTIAYSLTSENTFPQGDNPYNGSSVGTLRLTDTSVLVAGDVGELDFVGFTIASLGNGLVRITDTGGGGGGGGLGTWAYAASGSVSTKFSASADDLSTVTYFLISDDNTELSEMSLALADLPAGANLFLWDTDDETRCAQYTLGTVSDQAGYTTVPVTFVAETAGTGSAVTDEEWRFYVQPIADTDTSDHGALTGLTDDDHVRYVDVAGTREQDAVFFDYRADHVNAPAAGKAEIWVAPKGVLDSPMFTDSTGTDWTIARGSAMNDSEIPFWVAGVNGDYLFTSSGFTYASGKLTLGGGTADLSIVERATGPTFAVGTGMIWVKTDVPNQLWFTDDAGGESQVGNVVGPASAVNRTVPLFDGTTGKLLKDSVSMSYGGLQTNTLALTGGTGPALAIYETGTAPTNTAAYGKFWVKNDAPTIPMFTDDVSGDYQLGRAIPVPTTLASNELVQTDATEVVIGGGYLDGSTGGTFSWEILGIYNDNGGTGNQDIEVRLYDRGPDGTPVAGVLRSTIEITSLDTLDRVSQALTVASSPGVDADAIDSDEARLYEVRAYLDAGGGVDTAKLLSVVFVES